MYCTIHWKYVQYILANCFIGHHNQTDESVTTYFIATARLQTAQLIRELPIVVTSKHEVTIFHPTSYDFIKKLDRFFDDFFSKESCLFEPSKIVAIFYCSSRLDIHSNGNSCFLIIERHLLLDFFPSNY